ncbi:MAG: type III-B CRISPR module-associated protein Cmr5 [Chitinophagales bacterium]
MATQQLHKHNINQERAKAAWKYAEASKNNGNYGSYAKKFPMYVMNTGLLNAVAFAYNKSDWKQLYKDVQDWFSKEPQELIKSKLAANASKGDKALIETLLELNDNELRQVKSEVLALFTWLRRFVKD